MAAAGIQRGSSGDWGPSGPPYGRGANWDAWQGSVAHCDNKSWGRNQSNSGRWREETSARGQYDVHKYEEYLDDLATRKQRSQPDGGSCSTEPVPDNIAAKYLAELHARAPITSSAAREGESLAVDEGLAEALAGAVGWRDDQSDDDRFEEAQEGTSDHESGDASEEEESAAEASPVKGPAPAPNWTQKLMETRQKLGSLLGGGGPAGAEKAKAEEKEKEEKKKTPKMIRSQQVQEKWGIDPSGNDTKARLKEKLEKKRESEASAEMEQQESSQEAQARKEEEEKQKEEEAERTCEEIAAQEAAEEKKRLKNERRKENKKKKKEIEKLLEIETPAEVEVAPEIVPPESAPARAAEAPEAAPEEAGWTRATSNSRPPSFESSGSARGSPSEAAGRPPRPAAKDHKFAACDEEEEEMMQLALAMSIGDTEQRKQAAPKRGKASGHHAPVAPTRNSPSNPTLAPTRTSPHSVAVAPTRTSPKNPPLAPTRTSPLLAPTRTSPPLAPTRTSPTNPPVAPTRSAAAQSRSSPSAAATPASAPVEGPAPVRASAPPPPPSVAPPQVAVLNSVPPSSAAGAPPSAGPSAHGPSPGPPTMAPRSSPADIAGPRQGAFAALSAVPVPGRGSPASSNGAAMAPVGAQLRWIADRMAESMRLATKDFVPKEGAGLPPPAAQIAERERTATRGLWKKLASFQWPSKDLGHVRRVVSDGLPGAAKARRYAPRGMANTTNLCYFNAACQALLPCAPFAMLMSNAGGDTAAPVHAEMYRLLKQFYASHSTAAVDPAVHCKELLAAWGKARVERGQEDAGEFLIWIFDALHEECKWRPPGGAAGEEESPLTRCFGGRVRSTVTKIHDPSTVVETRFESFRVLPLPLGPDATSVAGAMKAYVQQCAAEGSDMHIKVHFDVLPPTLVLALNRTLFNVETGRAEKDTRSIQLDEILRIDGAWQSSVRGGQAAKPVEYRLTAVICHYGEETSSGHYNALAQQHDGQWYLYDDQAVRAVPAAELQAATSQTSAHVLVYQRPDCTVNVRPV